MNKLTKKEAQAKIDELREYIEKYDTIQEDDIKAFVIVACRGRDHMIIPMIDRDRIEEQCLGLSGHNGDMGSAYVCGPLTKHEMYKYLCKDFTKTDKRYTLVTE